jgi:hypothetical protein
MSNEPVALGGAVTALWQSMLAVVLIMGWVDEQQGGALAAVGVALGGLVTAWQRSKVTPVR